MMSVGVFFPRRWCNRASGIPVADLGFTLRLTSLRSCCNLAAPLAFGLGCGLDSVEIAKTATIVVSWKPTRRDDPEYLPSVGTLRRIRWPLQSRSRDSCTTFGDERTAEWHSRTILGLVPVLSRLQGWGRLATPFRP